MKPVFWAPVLGVLASQDSPAHAPVQTKTTENGQAHSVQTHDLLEIDAKQLILSQTSAPQWVEEDLPKSPFVVVRRGPAMGQEIPIGVRGTERNQRWAAFCHPRLVKNILTPPQLLSRTIPTARADAMPALLAFNLLKDLWMDLVLPWGPGGSIGFELASRRHVAKPESDLDIVIHAERRLATHEAKSLCDRAMNLLQSLIFVWRHLSAVSL
jgi:phosphoribosyl-dephospho-CoA transferase